MKRLLTPMNLIALVISLGFLALAFSRIDLKLLLQMVWTIEWMWSIPLIVLTLLSFWWRAWRWQVLLAPYKQIPMGTLYGPLMIGFAFNNIIPARAGEFARPLALQKVSGVPFATAISTVVLERVCDMIVLLTLFAGTLLFMELDPELSTVYDTRVSLTRGAVLQYVVVGTLAFAALTLGLAVWLRGWLGRARKNEGAKMAPWKRRLQSKLSAVLAFSLMVILLFGVLIGYALDSPDGLRMGREFILNAESFRGIANKAAIAVGILLGGALLMIWAPFREFMRGAIRLWGFMPEPLAKPLLSIFEAFAAGFNVLSQPRLGAQVMLHTAAVWALTAVPMWLMSFGVPGLEMSLADTIVFLVITCIVISLPAAPGFWGVYELGGMMALILVGVVPNTAEGQTLALGYTLVVHFIQWLLVTVIGLYYAARIHVSATDVESVRHAG
ncbi:MAG: lysylphosphatidylglycerol synthase transmembrane domain-containing protein [Candidatus Sumerlaeia bacterium]|nr:lysylphosphatidylglycerol synthase transmembrane domain-containing protein [Candidatus Sumerlaeia bacterium]